MNYGEDHDIEDVYDDYRQGDRDHNAHQLSSLSPMVLL